MQTIKEIVEKIECPDNIGGKHIFISCDERGVVTEWHPVCRCGEMEYNYRKQP